MTVGFVVTAVSEAGTTSLLTREMSRRPAEAGELLGAVLAIRTLTLPVSLLAAALAVEGLAPSHAVTILAVALTLPFQQLAEIPRAVLLVQGRMGLLACYVVIENVAWAMAITVGLAGGSVELGFIGAAGILCLSAATGILLVARSGTRPRRPSANGTRSFARQARPFAAFSVVTALSTRLDPILIGWLVSGDALAATGAYFAATRLVAAFEYLPEALARSIYPALSRAAHDAPSDFTILLHPASRTLIALGVAGPFAAAALAPWAMGVTFGDQFREFGWLAFLVALAVPARFVAMLLGVALTASDAHARRVVLTAVSLGLSIGLQLLLLPRIGVAGSAIAWIASSTFVVIVYAREIGSRYGQLPLAGDTLRAIIASGVGLAMAQAVLVLAPGNAREPLAAVALGASTILVLDALGMIEIPGTSRRRKPKRANGRARQPGGALTMRDQSLRLWCRGSRVPLDDDLRGQGTQNQDRDGDRDRESHHRDRQGERQEGKRQTIVPQMGKLRDGRPASRARDRPTPTQKQRLEPCGRASEGLPADQEAGQRDPDRLTQLEFAREVDRERCEHEGVAHVIHNLVEPRPERTRPTPGAGQLAVGAVQSVCQLPDDQDRECLADAGRRSQREHEQSAEHMECEPSDRHGVRCDAGSEKRGGDERADAIADVLGPQQIARSTRVLPQLTRALPHGHLSTASGFDVQPGPALRTTTRWQVRTSSDACAVRMARSAVMPTRSAAMSV